MTIICSYKDKCKNFGCGHRKPHDTVNNKWKNCLQTTDDGLWCYMANEKVTCVPCAYTIIPDVDVDEWIEWAEEAKSSIGFALPPKFNTFPDNDDVLYDITSDVKGGD